MLVGVGGASTVIVVEDDLPVWGDMIAALLSVHLDRWCEYAWQKDLLHKKISREEFEDIKSQSLLCGVAMADKCFELVNSYKTSQICQYFDIVLSNMDKDIDSGIVSFAQFSTPNKIAINNRPIEKASKLLSQLKDNPLKGLSQKTLKKILFAHELFHFLENKYAKTIYTQNKKIKLWQILGFKYMSTVRLTSEIAAFAFVKQFCKLEFWPFVLDFVLVSSYDFVVAKQIYDNVITM